MRLQWASPGKEVQGWGYGQGRDMPRTELQYRVRGEQGWIGVTRTNEGGSGVGLEVRRGHGVMVITENPNLPAQVRIQTQVRIWSNMD